MPELTAVFAEEQTISGGWEALVCIAMLAAVCFLGWCFWRD
jgi:hypothetical protein